VVAVVDARPSPFTGRRGSEVPTQAAFNLKAG
jgi:hypothetical protein